MIKLTAPDGQPVWIMTAWIQAIRRPDPNEYTHVTNAVVILSGINQAVCEHPARIAGMINFPTLHPDSLPKE